MPKKAKNKPKKAQKRQVVRKTLKKARKATKKAAPKTHRDSKVATKQQVKKDETTGIYEETTVTCPGCGRQTKMIKISGLDTEGMLCQRCVKGEIELGDMDF